MSIDRDDCASESCECNGVNRRAFLKATSAAIAGMSLGAIPAIAGPFTPEETADHFIPVDKKLRPEWIKLLFARGEKQVYDGDALKMIGMPVGGITTGQVYLGGDGKLLYWQIFNQTDFTGYGLKNYSADPPTSPIEQGFTIAVTTDDKKTVSRPLDKTGFPGVKFCGEYPIGWVDYADPTFPVAVTLEAFSPFCPLSEEDSALPATVLRFTLKNMTPRPVEAKLTGILQNAVCRFSGDVLEGERVNQAVREKDWRMILSSARATEAPKAARPPIQFETFEGADYAKWTPEGEAFGKAPAKGTLQGQQNVTGFAGKGLVNTFLNGDKPHGKLTSPAFKIERNFICFLLGGGNHADKTCMNLLVDGKIVRTMTGRANEKLEPRYWDVKDLAGKEARLQIVDAESGPWGHINVDQIEFRDTPRTAFSGPLDQQSDFGTMGLAVLSSGAQTSVSADGGPPPGQAEPAPAAVANPFSQKLTGSVAAGLTLASGELKTLTFIIAWHFPNREKKGNFYATRFKDAADVVRHITANFDRLHNQTKLWHKTWYEDSTLPRWLLDRLFSTVSTLATGTCQQWANGRFWAWEGVGCCHGTCAHVWNYEHAMARLFPALERSCRTMQDLEPSAGFIEATGEVRFRGEGWKQWAGDSQGGTALKCLREHQHSADDSFLKQYWPRIKKTIQFLIDQDADGDGLIEGKQHNTYDIDFYGPNTMVGSLYLGALRAGEEMAKEMKEGEFAKACRQIFEKGVKSTLERLWNGEYFIQQVDLARHPKFQYATGCLADHLFGAGWAHQVGLGYLYPREKALSALKAIWVYNWAPDVGPQNQTHPPERWFARPGEAGLFTCTWPKSKHLGKESVRYRDEIWTGIEYQVAGHMAWEGMLTEALAICRGIHERYHPARHNPWNEIECGDHYARGMASYGVFLALCGFEYHGPRGHIGFAPRITPENFSAAFTGAQGWGTYLQKIESGALSAKIELKWGSLRLRSISLALPEGAKAGAVTITAPAGEIKAEVAIRDGKALIAFANDVNLKPGERIQIEIK